ncbi:MAG: Glutathione S-transferase [Gammaproteobacteria bacterium]|nr:Glutathione S-transferase [Gammaproteobacteria bacterium]
MSSLTLVSHPICPFVQRAAIALLEKGVPFERIDVDLTAKPDWFLAISPLGKVPLLKVPRGDGNEVILFESMVICEYLEESQSGARLHPADPLARAQHRAWIEYGNTILADAWGFLSAKEAATAAAKQSAFREKLLRLEAALGGGPYFAGERFSLVDAVFGPIFRYFDVLPPRISETIFVDLPRVAEWRQGLRYRPSVRSAVPNDYGERLKAHLHRQGALLGV